jgi:mono/diheme cytochrome c family protein
MDMTGLSSMTFCGALAGFVVFAASAQELSAGDPRVGRVLALKFCTSCHVVETDQEFPPIFKGPPEPPNFQTIASRPSTTAQSLRKFLSTTHSTMTLPLHMPNPEITDDQTTQIISFILSLRDRRQQ